MKPLTLDEVEGVGTVSRPRLLDLFCCAGGTGMGYHRAGFDVVGVDINPQPHYPFEFHQGDALEYLAAHGHEFDAIHASPPCQAFTNARKLQGNTHPDLIAPVRAMLVALELPWVIENVVGAPLISPVLLCGSMFDGLRVYRHRLFEANFPIAVPTHPSHVAKNTKMGRPPKADEFMHVVGHFSGVPEARIAMGIEWMGQSGLREAIPPAYTEYIGRQLTDWLTTTEEETTDAA